ncbi:hypothetical protein AB4156_16260 [Cupriavidus sp. 2MCAB6]|uniref:hypothetical protein n=1 Tax=Cupriavidus sp. 2MCAB6 TaxID=3232981 RepID=UPI003F938B1A
MALGKNVEHLRNLRSMSRGAVARAIGLEDDQPIYALEKRDSKRSNLAPALAKLFQVSLESLLGDDLTSLSAEEIGAGVNSPLVTEHVSANAELGQLTSAFEALSPPGQLELLRFAEYLVAKEKGTA